MRRVVILVMSVVAACTYGADAEPRPIDGFGDEATLPPAAPAGEGAPAVLWYVEGIRLVPVMVESASDEPTDLLAALLAGRGLEVGSTGRSSIPPGTTILGVDVSDGVATVDVSRDFTLIGGDEELLAIGQIVLTTVAAPSVDGVVFTIEGAAVEAPTGEGALVERPLTAADFDALVATDA